MACRQIAEADALQRRQRVPVLTAAADLPARKSCPINEQDFDASSRQFARRRRACRTRTHHQDGPKPPCRFVKGEGHGRLHVSSMRHGQRHDTVAPCSPACSANVRNSVRVNAACTDKGPSV